MTVVEDRARPLVVLHTHPQPAARTFTAAGMAALNERFTVIDFSVTGDGTPRRAVRRPGRERYLGDSNSAVIRNQQLAL